MQVKKRITDIMFEFELSFHHMESPTNTPQKRTRFVSGLPNQFNNTSFSYTNFLNAFDLVICSI